TGPYRWWKVAGPPRLSLADRGITFATTAEHGVCLQLAEPIGAIDPLHLIRHPNVTITVADPERFADEVRRAAATRPASAPAATPPRRAGRPLATLGAWGRWRRRDRCVPALEHVVASIAPPAAAAAATDAQPLGDGVGVRFHRRYQLVVDTSMSATEAMAAIQADPNLLTREEFAPFERIAGVAGQMQVGDRYVVELAGPWK